MEDKNRISAAARLAALAPGVSPVGRADNLVEALRSYTTNMAPLAMPAPEPAPPSTVDFMWAVLEAPLYTPIALHKDYNKQIADFRQTETQYDRYCPYCKVQTPWTVRVPSGIHGLKSYLGTFTYSCICKRCDRSVAHHLIALGRPTNVDGEFGTVDVKLTKLGQWPSLAEFHKNDLGPYEKVTTKEQREDFTRAIQAAASGFAAGACTYLRRVLESIIDEALEEERKEGVAPDWEAQYKAARTNKRMEMLAGHLPAFLMRNKRLYALLSEGLHKLSDDECQELFPNLRQAIELIFKGRNDILQQRKHEDEISRFIAQNDPKG